MMHNTVKHALHSLAQCRCWKCCAEGRLAQDFCEFCSVEFREIRRHVTTGWLSLNPAVARVMQTWTALKCYLGVECPRHISSLLQLSEDNRGPPRHCRLEVYLLFCSSILSPVEEVVKKLESNSPVFSYMMQTRQGHISQNSNLICWETVWLFREQLAVLSANSLSAIEWLPTTILRLWWAKVGCRRSVEVQRCGCCGNFKVFKVFIVWL